VYGITVYYYITSGSIIVIEIVSNIKVIVDNGIKVLTRFGNRPPVSRRKIPGELQVSRYCANFAVKSMCYTCVINVTLSPFSALTLWMGDRKSIQPVKSCVLVCWW